MTQKKRIILHCGAPKTATSSLQSIFMTVKDTLLQHGIYYMERRPFKKEKYKIHKAFIMAKHGRRENAILRGQEFMREAFDQHDIHTILLSNESVLHDPLLEHESNLYPQMDRVAPILKDIFADYELHIKFMIRKQSDFIPSYYTQRVRQGLTMSLEDYSNCFDLQHLSWDAVIHRLQYHFGADYVNYNCFENYKNDPETVIKNLFPELSAVTLVNTNEHKNSSPSASALWAMRHYNKLMDACFGPNKNERDHIRHRIQRHLRARQFPVMERLYPGQKIKLNQDIYDQLAILYELDCQKLNL